MTQKPGCAAATASVDDPRGSSASGAQLESFEQNQHDILLDGGESFGRDRPSGHALQEVEAVMVARRGGTRRGRGRGLVGRDLMNFGAESVFLSAVLLVACFAQRGEAAASTLRVASCVGEANERPPYVITEDKGFEIELWERIYQEMVIRAFKLGNSVVIGIVGDGSPPMVAMSRADIKRGLQMGTVDVGICAMSAEKSEHMAFAHPHLASGLRAVVKLELSRVDFVQVLVRGIFRPFTNVYAQAALLLILYFAILVAHVIWLLERRDNSQQFNAAYGPGIIDSLWWALVTALTVGYGDKINTTIPSKLVAIIWMILSAFFVGIFAAALTSSFLVGSLDQATGITIEKVADLSLYKVGVASNVAAETIKNEAKGTVLILYDDEVKLLQALKNGDIQVAVQDSRTAQYMANKVSEFSGKVRPTGITFGDVHLAVAVVYNGTYHPAHKVISDSVFEVVTGSGKAAYDELSVRWLGSDEFISGTGNAELEQALAESNKVAALVLTGLALLWAFAVFLHMRDEIREELIRNKLRLALGLSKRFNMMQLRQGAERLFDKHDVDGSGTLDIQEIVGVLQSLGKDVELDDVMHYIDRELENRDSLPPTLMAPMAKNFGDPHAAMQVGEDRTLSASNETDGGITEEADELLKSLDSARTGSSEHPPELPAEQGGAPVPPSRDSLLITVEPNVDIGRRDSTGLMSDKGQSSPKKAPGASMFSTMTASVAPLTAMMQDPMKRYENTTVNKEEFVRIIEGLILDEEDDTDEGEINPQGPTQQKHLLHLGGEIQKQVHDVELVVGGRVDGVVSEVALLQAKLDLVLENLGVSEEKIRISGVEAAKALQAPSPMAGMGAGGQPMRSQSKRVLLGDPGTGKSSSRDGDAGIGGLLSRRRGRPGGK